MSRRVFWPGFNWRVLAHKRIPEGEGWWRCHFCGWNGRDLDKHPKRCEGTVGAYDFDRRRPDQTRRIVHSTTVALCNEDFAEPVEFDELVIDDWLHLEQMGDRDWWIGVGNGDDYWHVNVRIDRDGRASVSMEKQ